MSRVLVFSCPAHIAVVRRRSPCLERTSSSMQTGELTHVGHPIGRSLGKASLLTTGLCRTRRGPKTTGRRPTRQAGGQAGRAIRPV